MNTPHKRKEWLEFKDWCQDRRLNHFPAHPWTVAAYMVWLDANRRYRTMQKRLDVISRVHIRQCVRAPDLEGVVLRTLKAIEARRNGTLCDYEDMAYLEPSRRKLAPLTLETRRQMARTPPLVSKRPLDVEKRT